jgi:DNA-binding response OmpR family regulator
VQNTILVVDSDTNMQLLLLRLFAEGGHAVIAAGDGAEAIARLEAEHPGLVVANVDLPGRSGVEVCRYVKGRPEAVPVILLAPGTDPGPIEPADAVVGVPIDAQKLLDAVRRVFDMGQGQPVRPDRLLVIDDDLGILSLLESLLSKEGYEVTTADCGRDGLAAIERCQPDMVLLDVQMPGMSGFEVLTLIRERHPTLPVVMVTGYGSEDVATQALRLGADDYLAKPLRVRNVCFRIQSTLERARLRASQARLNRQLRQTTLELTDRLQRAIEANAAFRDLLCRILGELRDGLERGGSISEAIELVSRLRQIAEAKHPITYEAIAEALRKALHPDPPR